MKNELKVVYAQTMKEMSQVIESCPWESESFYKLWLAQTHNFVCHSTRIVALAGALFPYEQNEYHLSSIVHLNQEKNHEKMLVKDLEHLGGQLSDLPKMPHSNIFFQTQYYWIQHVHPISVYGYYLFLEGLAAEIGPVIYNRLKAAFPEKSLSFMKLHALEDPEHIQEHLMKLETTNQYEQKMILENFHQSAKIYQSILGEIRGWSTGTLPKVA